MSWADFEEAWQKSPAPGQSAETSSQEKTSLRKVAGLSREKAQSTVVIFVELARSPVQLLVLGYPSTQHGPTQGLQHGKDLFHKPFRKGFGSKRRGANLATRPRGTDFTVSTNKRPRSQPVLSMSFHNRGLVQDGRSDSCTTRVPPRMPGDGCPLSKTSSGQRASV